MSVSAPGRAAASEVDVAIVGASLAGCATAILLGRAGLRVALVDKHADGNAYKRLCGHFIQASATPVIERLGLVEPIEAAGGVRNGVDILTRWGTIGTPGERPHGYSLRRQKLDPIIRTAALETPGVDYLPGQRVTALLGGASDARSGVELTDRDGRRTLVPARMVVGADGRDSTVAKLAGARERRSPNTRFCYATYFSGVGLPERCAGRMWMTGSHDLALVAPNDDGLTVLAVFLDDGRLDEFRGRDRDREGALRDIFGELPESPLMEGAQREEKVQGYTDYELVVRDPIPLPTVALVGDAALTSDPAMGIGCGWALESAAWLADSIAPALAAGDPLQPALRRYKRERRKLMGHHRLIALYARMRSLTPIQRMMFAAAVSDADVRAEVLAFGERAIPVRRIFTPAILTRAARATLGAGTAKTPG